MIRRSTENGIPWVVRLCRVPASPSVGCTHFSPRQHDSPLIADDLGPLPTTTGASVSPDTGSPPFPLKCFARSAKALSGPPNSLSARSPSAVSSEEAHEEVGEVQGPDEARKGKESGQSSPADMSPRGPPPPLPPPPPPLYCVFSSAFVGVGAAA